MILKKVSPRCCCLSGIQSNISKHEKNKNRQTTTTKECWCWSRDECCWLTVSGAGAAEEAALPAGVTVWQPWEGSSQFLWPILERRFCNTPLGELFDLTLLEHLLLKNSIAAVYLFFSIMILNSQKLEKLILHLRKMMLSIGKYFL